MHSFFARTSFANPGLHVWREGTSIKLYLRPEAPPDPDGWVEFRCDLQADICCEPVKFMLFDFKADSSPGEYEK
ncbi:MAG TPA: hypothetical protein VMM56_14820, partial [Planctomycetaceae bacterium]|nr:hypothetical protein [Planctomycetaceae bacterium]